MPRDKTKARTLFVLRTYNDVDHISPVIWKFIKKGEYPIILFHTSFDYGNDYRINFLKSVGEIEVYQKPDYAFEKFSTNSNEPNIFSGLEKLKKRYYLRKRNNKTKFGKFHRRLFFNCSSEIAWLKEKDIKAVVFEWNSPFIRGEILEKIFFAAKSIGIPTFSIPHGCNIYINSDIHEVYRRNMAKGRLPDFSDRNIFDYYVVQSKVHLEHNVRFGFDRNTISAWGSARFYPEWQKINLKLCEKFNAQLDVTNKVKVVFMLPHWNYNSKKIKSLQLLDALSELSWVHIVIKDHTRGKFGLLPQTYQKKYGDLSNVEINVNSHSPALIDWSDVVINFGSSIGIEALLQGKILIYPAYLHSNVTIFDITKAAIIANRLEEVMEIMHSTRTNSEPSVQQKEVDEIYKSVIYGGNDPFDVLEYYYNQIVTKTQIM